jgi:membrane protein YqaA with SNARE-associated domain
MIKKLNNWYFRLSGTTYGPVLLFIAAFAEASFIPFPVVVLFIAMLLANSSNSYLKAGVATAGTVAGAAAGWAIGHFIWLNNDADFTGFAVFMFDHIPGFSVDLYEDIRVLYQKYDVWLLFTAVLTPLPYKYFAVSSGMFDMNLGMLLIITLISQALRYMGLAFLINRYGARINEMIHGYFKPVAIFITATAVLAIIMIKIF